MRLRELLVIGCLCAASTAFAQKEAQLGSRLTPRQSINSVQNNAAAVQAGHRLAGCIYLKKGAQVTSALDAVDRTDATRRLNALQVKGTCINLIMLNEFADEQRMRLPDDIYRGMLAEAVIRDKYARHALQSMDRQPAYSRDWFAATGRPQAIDEMGVCVAETDPGNIQALLTTTAETENERAAFRMLSPSLGPCLSADTKLTSNRQSLRAGLAEALYHRFTEPSATVGPASDK